MLRCCGNLATDTLVPYRLIPLAICCICEATGTWEEFMSKFKQTSDKLTIVREGRLLGLAARLQGELTFLQRIKAVATVQPAQNAALQPSSFQDLANIVTVADKQHLRGLQRAYKSAITGYNCQQAGNCLYWLFKEPQESAAVPSDNTEASGSRPGRKGQHQRKVGKSPSLVRESPSLSKQMLQKRTVERRRMQKPAPMREGPSGLHYQSLCWQQLPFWLGSPLEQVATRSSCAPPSTPSAMSKIVIT